LLKRLAASGLVQRSRSSADEREVEVALTDEGRALEDRARSVPETVECATGLSRDEIVDLRDRLTELRTSLRANVTG
jgi:DNA-binding MarR family transcriptional regulator